MAQVYATPMTSEKFACNEASKRALKRWREKKLWPLSIFPGLAAGKFAIDIAGSLLLHQGAALIVRLLTFGDRDFNLRLAIFKVELQRDESDTGIFCTRRNLA